MMRGVAGARQVRVLAFKLFVGRGGVLRETPPLAGGKLAAEAGHTFLFTYRTTRDFQADGNVMLKCWLDESIALNDSLIANLSLTNGAGGGRAAECRRYACAVQEFVDPAFDRTAADGGDAVEMDVIMKRRPVLIHLTMQQFGIARGDMLELSISLQPSAPESLAGRRRLHFGGACPAYLAIGESAVPRSPDQINLGSSHRVSTGGNT